MANLRVWLVCGWFGLCVCVQGGGGGGWGGWGGGGGERDFEWNFSK